MVTQYLFVIIISSIISSTIFGGADMLNAIFNSYEVEVYDDYYETLYDISGDKATFSGGNINDSYEENDKYILDLEEYDSYNNSIINGNELLNIIKGNDNLCILLQNKFNKYTYCNLGAGVSKVGTGGKEKGYTLIEKNISGSYYSILECEIFRVVDDFQGEWYDGSPYENFNDNQSDINILYDEESEYYIDKDLFYKITIIKNGFGSDKANGIVINLSLPKYDIEDLSYYDGIEVDYVTAGSLVNNASELDYALFYRNGDMNVNSYINPGVQLSEIGKEDSWFGYMIEDINNYIENIDGKFIGSFYDGDSGPVDAGGYTAILFEPEYFMDKNSKYRCTAIYNKVKPEEVIGVILEMQ